MSTGGPVYPSQPLGQDGLPEHSFEWGLTLRDYFAGKVFETCLSQDKSWDPHDVAHISYLYADAMIKERDK